MNTRIADKLRKLLALSTNNANPSEAANAFAAAQALATKHRIELASVEIGEDPADAEMVQERISVVKGTRVAGWKKKLAWGLDCLGVYPLAQGGAGTVSFAGRRADVDTAVYMYRAISNEIERLAKIQARSQGRRYANAFKMGAARTVVSRLRKMHKSTLQGARDAGADPSALVKVENASSVAETWLRSDPDVSIRRGPRIIVSSGDGYAAGERAGRDVNIGGNRAVGRGNLALGQG